MSPTRQPGYLPFTQDNPHHVARRHAGATDFAPRKWDLYGYKPADSLAQGSRGKPKPGSLQSALTYGESTAPHLWEVRRALQELQSDADDSRLDDIGDILNPIINTVSGAYQMVNEQRALIVHRARCMAPDADEYEKDELGRMQRWRRGGRRLRLRRLARREPNEPQARARSDGRHAV